MFSDAQVNEYAAGKSYAAGTILWAADRPLDEDAFRSGNKTAAGCDFLRWQDIGMVIIKGAGRIPDVDQESHFVEPGQGISLFIKRMLPEGMKHAGRSPDADKRALKAQFDPLIERSWWRIEAGRPIPDELQLVFDGVPPGHCTLTVTRRLSVRQFLDRVALIRFEFAGTDYFGVAKP